MSALPIIIADSGSTKTDWTIINDGVATPFCTSGINPMMQSSSSIAETLRSESGMWSELEGGRLFFYGAGCIGESAQRNIKDAITAVFAPSAVEINSDLLGAARALCGHKAGIACILGTGANSCLYDGEKIVANTHPLGYILGDEGSGAYIGRRIVADVLKGLMPDDITRLFWEWCGTTYEEIIENVYRRPYPNRYLANVTHFAKQNISHPAISGIVEEAFASFIGRNLCQYGDLTSQPIGFVGSVANAFEDKLRHVMDAKGLTLGRILHSPMEGLIEWHTA